MIVILAVLLARWRLQLSPPTGARRSAFPVRPSAFLKQRLRRRIRGRRARRGFITWTPRNPPPPTRTILTARRPSRAHSIPVVLPAGVRRRVARHLRYVAQRPRRSSPRARARRPVFIRGVSADEPAPRAPGLGGQRHVRHYRKHRVRADARSIEHRLAGHPAARQPRRRFATAISMARLSGGGLGIVNWEVGYGEVYTGTGVIDNVVIYDNTIHDNGDLKCRLRSGRARHYRRATTSTISGWSTTSCTGTAATAFRSMPAIERRRATTHHHLRRPQRLARQQADRVLGEAGDRRDLLAERILRSSPEQFVARPVHGRAVHARLGVVHLQPRPRLRIRHHADVRHIGEPSAGRSSSATSSRTSINTRRPTTRPMHGGRRRS